MQTYRPIPVESYGSIPFEDLGTSGFRKNGVLSTGLDSDQLSPQSTPKRIIPTANIESTTTSPESPHSKPSCAARRSLPSFINEAELSFPIINTFEAFPEFAVWLRERGLSYGVSHSQVQDDYKDDEDLGGISQRQGGSPGSDNPSLTVPAHDTEGTYLENTYPAPDCEDSFLFVPMPASPVESSKSNVDRERPVTICYPPHSPTRPRCKQALRKAKAVMKELQVLEGVCARLRRRHRRLIFEANGGIVSRSPVKENKENLVEE